LIEIFVYLICTNGTAKMFFLLLVQVKPNEVVKDSYGKQTERFFDSLQVHPIDEKKVGM